MDAFSPENTMRKWPEERQSLQDENRKVISLLFNPLKKCQKHQQEDQCLTPEGDLSFPLKQESERSHG